MRLNLDYVPQNINQHLRRGLVGIDAMHEFLAVISQHGFGFAFVGFLTIFDHVDVGIVEPILLERSALQSFDQLVHSVAAEKKNRHDVERIVQDFGLLRIAGNPIEHKSILLRPEAARFGAGMDKLPPQFDGRPIRHELATTGVIQEHLADGGVVLEAPKDVTTGAMVEVGNRAQDFTLGAFSGAGGAE